nr:uncharacterized protein LOC109169177 [Ipomoea trifida]
MPPRRSSRSASSSSGKAPATPPLIIVPFAHRQTLSRSASSSSGKAPATPPLIIVPFAHRQTLSTTRRAIVAAREAPPVPEYQQPTAILEAVSPTIMRLVRKILDEEIGDFPSNSQIAVENLRTHDPEYTPSLPTDHRAASLVLGVQSVSTQKQRMKVIFPSQRVTRSASRLQQSAPAACRRRQSPAAAPRPAQPAVEHISAKDFIGQRKLLLKDFASTPGLCDILHSARLFQTVVRVEKFVRSVVCEFYANLVPELIRFGQAYVRGRMYAFNPMVINQFFGSFDCDADYTEDMDVVTRRLTGGTRVRWVKNDTIKVVELTSTFAYLHKIAYSNWMPTTQKGYVPRAMAVLLFKIASGIQVNLGKLLFYEVVDARNGAKGRKDLILPNLIYSLLVVQGFEKDASEFYEPEPKLIKADHRLLTTVIGTHIDDLAGPNDNVGPSSAVDTTSVTVAFLENELRLIHDHPQMLSTREAWITGLLSTLRQNTNDGDSLDCEVASSSDESVAF